MHNRIVFRTKNIERQAAQSTAENRACLAMPRQLPGPEVAWLAIWGWALWGWIALGVAFSLCGAENETKPSPVGTPDTRVFNVFHYGAAGDDKTDNTAAFSACLKAVIDAGGGRMYVPAGVYNGRIVIPPIEPPRWFSLEIVGESQPASTFGTVGRFEMQNNNSIIKCVADDGPAVISATPASPQAGSFSGVNVVIKDLEVRTCNDPRIGGIDLEWAQQCRLENVFVNSGIYNVQAAKPTRNTKGLVTPAINNGALTVLRNVIVTGYHTGIVVNEHTDGENVVVASNIDGLCFAKAYHASRFGRVGAYRCTNMITVTGQHGFSISQLNIEHAGPGQTDGNNAWQTTVNDLNDPDNLGIADVNYWVVLGNVGVSEIFTRNGGASILTRRIGSAPSAVEKTGNDKKDENQ
jgi:hypothetical protein